MKNSRYIALIFLLEACLLFCMGRAFAQSVATEAAGGVIGDAGVANESAIVATEAVRAAVVDTESAVGAPGASVVVPGNAGIVTEATGAVGVVPGATGAVGVVPGAAVTFEVSPGVDPKSLTFRQRNSGAFKRRKKGGMKDPGMAVLCSSLVPGLGQIYNGQWWKTPVVYAGGAVGGYFIHYMLKNRKVYDTEIRARYDGNTAAMNPAFAGDSDSQLYDVRNYYEQYFELSIILTAAWYLLNIMDAAVYAHLFSFNISPDLSLSVKPYLGLPGGSLSGGGACYYAGMPPYNAGLRFCLTF